MVKDFIIHGARAPNTIYKKNPNGNYFRYKKFCL